MTRRVGLIGFPLGHSISPAFQQAAFDALGVDARYERWEVPAERLGEVVARVRRPDGLGANVTIPHKQAVRAYLDEIDAEAWAVGAVNTIVKVGDRLVGQNTDVRGFGRAVRDDGGATLNGETVVVLGAGGAARAVVAAAMSEGAREVLICARRVEQAEALAAELAASPLGNARTALSCRSLSASALEGDQRVTGARVVVNATPIGMAGPHADDAPPWPASLIRPTMLVVDLIYNPPVTPLLRLARAVGAKTLNGLPMLVYQGAAAFELWTGREAPVDLMRRVAEEALGV